MRKMRNPQDLPLFTALAGIVGLTLRRQLYIWGPDDKGLLQTGHPLALVLWLVTAVVLAALAGKVWKSKGINSYEANFAPSRAAAAGHILAGAGFALTALLNEPLLRSALGSGWTVLGILSGPCLMLAGIARAGGKKPFFGLYMVPCLFLVLHVIDHYQLWSGDPQIHNYVFELLAAMALILFAYHNAAFCVDSGSRRMQLFSGLAALYLGLTALGRTEHLFLYAGGLAWVVSGLCALAPKQAGSEEGERAHDQG